MSSRSPCRSICRTPSGSISAGEHGEVAVRLLAGRAAHERGDRAPAHALARRAREIRHARERDGRRERQRRRVEERIGLPDPLPRREPEREVPARRVADGRDAREVQRMRAREDAHVVGRRGDVPERARPSASGLADAAVLDVPRRETRRRDRRRKRVHEVETVPGTPEAAVYDDRDGMRPGAGGQPQLPELRLLGSVGNSDGRFEEEEKKEEEDFFEGKRGLGPRARLASGGRSRRYRPKLPF